MAIPISAARLQHNEFLAAIHLDYCDEVGKLEAEKVIWQFQQELGEWLEKRQSTIDVRALCVAVGVTSDKIIANIIHEITDTRPQ